MKPIPDEINWRPLPREFTAEEFDFTVDCEIRCRLGRDAGEEER